MDPHHPASDGAADAAGTGPVVEFVAGDFLLTTGQAEGSEIAPCPPDRRPPPPRRTRPQPGLGAAAGMVGTAEPAEPGEAAPPLLGRQRERERLGRLLSRGRSVRLTGAPGAGRTALLAAVAEDCATLAPHGVICLNGHQRTAEDLLHELYAAVFESPLHRPGREELTTALREIGAVVVIDDVEIGGGALDGVLAATPECAYLLAAPLGAPDLAAGSRIEEHFLDGLDSPTCLELLRLTAGRPLGEDETEWAGDLWLACEGLPLRFVQAGALLRQRDEAGTTGPFPGGDGVTSPGEPGAAAWLAPTLAGSLSPAAREFLRIAVGLGGELPDVEHLSVLTGGGPVAAAHAELLDSGLVTAVGPRHRVSAATTTELASSGFLDGATARALTCVQHYTRWLAEPSTRAEQAVDEADVLLAVAQAGRRGGHAAAVVDLARAAAPPLATQPRWSVWERMLRCGAESARLAGDVARQAYFHHELGVLAICQGQLGRARAELEASTALRGVLSDAGGADAGRRALELVTSLARPDTPARGRETPPSGVPADTGTPPASRVGPEDSTRALPAQPPPTPRDEPADATVTIGSGDPEGGGRFAGVRRAAAAGARRNALAVAAGAMLLVVLGTVVTLGLVSDPDDDPAGEGQPDPTVGDPTPGWDADDPSDPALPTQPTPEQPPGPIPSASSSSTDPSVAGLASSDPTTPDPTTPSPTSPDPTTTKPTDASPSDPTTPPVSPTATGSGGATSGGGSGGNGGNGGAGDPGGTDEGADSGPTGGTDEGSSEGGAGGTDEGSSEGGAGGTDEGSSEGAAGGTDEGSTDGAAGGAAGGSPSDTAGG